MEGEKKELTAKQEKFCIEYLVDFNATQAAIRAGYSAKTAGQIGEQNLKKLEIAAYIEDARNKDAESAGISRKMVLEGYRKLAFYDARKFYDESGNLIPIHKLDDETAFALLGFDVLQMGGEDMPITVRKIKMSDRKSSLDSISKVMGYNAADKSEVTVNGFLDYLKQSSNDE